MAVATLAVMAMVAATMVTMTVVAVGLLRNALGFVVYHHALSTLQAQHCGTRIVLLDALSFAVLHDAVVAHRARRRCARIVVLDTAAHAGGIVEMRTFDTQSDRIADAHPAAVCAAVCGITVVGHVVDTLARAWTGEARDPTAEDVCNALSPVALGLAMSPCDAAYQRTGICVGIDCDQRCTDVVRTFRSF
jgi:hypothetical protein